jgi:hypothetical protein
MKKYEDKLDRMEQAIGMIREGFNDNKMEVEKLKHIISDKKGQERLVYAGEVKDDTYESLNMKKERVQKMHEQEKKLNDKLKLKIEQVKKEKKKEYQDMKSKNIDGIINQHRKEEEIRNSIPLRKDTKESKKEEKPFEIYKDKEQKEIIEKKHEEMIEKKKQEYQMMKYGKLLGKEERIQSTKWATKKAETQKIDKENIAPNQKQEKEEKQDKQEKNLNRPLEIQNKKENKPQNKFIKKEIINKKM